MMQRIVSLLPSATEIVCALGAGESLVGRSHECDYPKRVQRLPVCTAAKIDAGHSARTIHASITEILRSDISVYRVDDDLLRQLAPTHIITQVQCEVCAVSLRDVEAALAGWSGAHPRIVPLNPQSLDDVFDDIRRVGRSIGREQATVDVVASMNARMQLVARAPQSERRPRVAVIEWIEPLMVAGNWMPTLVEMAGGTPLLSAAGCPSEWIRWEDLLRADPEVIIVSPCGFRVADSRRDWHALSSHPLWTSLRAVRDGRLYIADGHHYFNRPGPRLVESLEILSEILQPDAFHFGHEGAAWERRAA
jgi:iron complex transport system substrate-binding protein